MKHLCFMITMFLLIFVCYHNVVLRNTVLIIWYSIAIFCIMLILQYCLVHNLLSLLILLTILSACGVFLSSRKSVAPRSVTTISFKGPVLTPQKNATAAQPLSACCYEIFIFDLLTTTQQCYYYHSNQQSPS